MQLLQHLTLCESFSRYNFTPFKRMDTVSKGCSRRPVRREDGCYLIGACYWPRSLVSPVNRRVKTGHREHRILLPLIAWVFGLSTTDDCQGWADAGKTSRLSSRRRPVQLINTGKGAIGGRRFVTYPGIVHVSPHHSPAPDHPCHANPEFQQRGLSAKPGYEQYAGHGEYIIEYARFKLFTSE